MSRLNRALYEINQLHTLAVRDQWMNRIHPLVKLLFTVIYVIGVMWIPKYDLEAIILVGIIPLVILILSELSIRQALWRIRLMILFFGVMGICSMIFDRVPVAEIHTFIVTGGMIAAAAILCKGIFCALAGYILVASTTVENLCYAMSLLHIPAILITQIQLMYRYISLLLMEAHRMEQAYMLRAPGQKGIHFKVWGSLLGQLLVRSMDRAQNVYESMLLRGYQGKFYYDTGRKQYESHSSGNERR